MNADQPTQHKAVGPFPWGALAIAVGSRGVQEDRRSAQGGRDGLRGRDAEGRGRGDRGPQFSQFSRNFPQSSAIFLRLFRDCFLLVPLACVLVPWVSPVRRCCS